MAAVQDYELEKEDILVVADQVTENITYYISSSLMSAAAASAPAYYTLDRLDSRMGTIPLFWTEAFPHLEEQLPHAANRVLAPGYPKSGFGLWEEANKTVDGAGDADVDVRRGKIDDYRGTTEHNYNMSAYDLSNHTLEPAYADFAAYNLKNSTATMFDPDTDKKRVMQIHYSGFPSFELAWKEQVATILGAQHGVSASRIEITDYGAADCNISLYFSTRFIAHFRTKVNEQVPGAAAALAYQPGVYGPLGAGGVMGTAWVPDFGDLGEEFFLSELVTSLPFPSTTDVEDFADDIVDGVEEAWNDGNSWIDSMLSDGGSYLEGGLNFGQELIYDGGDFLQEIGDTAAGGLKWTEDQVGHLTGMAGDLLGGIPLLIIIVIIGAVLFFAALLIWNFFLKEPVPS